MAKRSFRALLAAAKQRDSLHSAKAIQDFTEDLYRLMEEQNVNKAELARRIGKSRAYVTKVLRGNSNFTVESMVCLARALEGQLCIHIAHGGPAYELVEEERSLAEVANETNVGC